MVFIFMIYRVKSQKKDKKLKYYFENDVVRLSYAFVF